MPFKPDGTDVPGVVRKLPPKKRRQWAQIWNAAFAKCQKEGGKNCESSAFAQANAVVLSKQRPK
jgi:hypothetical protein